MNRPKVSFGLPVYNGEKYLRSALDCILAQDFTDFEVVICDNASTDGTAAICREYAAKDSRIRYARNETNIGATGNYNRVFELSRGEFFKWASHDDEFHPTLVRRCLETFDRSRRDVVLVFSRAEVIDDEGKLIKISRDTINPGAQRPFSRLASLIFNRNIAHPLWGLVRSEAMRRTRLMGFTETDHVMLGELALQGPFVEIPELLYRIRRHTGSAIQIHRTARAILAFNDPTKATARLLLPHWLRWDAEYWRGINHARLSLVQRFLCYVVVLVVPVWRWLLITTRGWRHRFGLKRAEQSPLKSESTTVGAK